MPQLPLVPAPASLVETGGGPFRLTAATAVRGEEAAVRELSLLLQARTARAVGLDEHGTGPAIELRLEKGAEAESYRLSADAGSIVVTGADAAGLFYGVQTLAQLVRRDGQGWAVPAVDIEDAPRFAYRGVMLDVARHFLPSETVKAYIDRASRLKFNVLHLHLTDDQGWRLHLRSRPLLTERGSASAVGGDSGGFYDHDEYRDLVAYAAARHVTVVPEIDVPGHTHAVGLAHPELAADPVITDEVRDAVERFGGGLPAPGTPYEGLAVGFSSLRMDDEATYDFLADVFGELASLTPGPYLHLGGDEALGTDPEDYAEFMRRASALIAGLGKIPVAWHEAGAAPRLHDDTVGQYWGYVTPPDGAAELTRAFDRVILSPADAVYLDMKADPDSPLGLTWANGVTTLHRAYAWEPAEVIDGVEDDDILGIEAPLWSETVRTLADVDQLAYPRIAAAAEAAWSPRSGTTPLRTWESFRERVGGLGPLWTNLGIGFSPLTEVDWVRD